MTKKEQSREFIMRKPHDEPRHRRKGCPAHRRHGRHHHTGGTRVLLTEHTGIGKDQPYSRKALSHLAFLSWTAGKRPARRPWSSCTAKVPATPCACIRGQRIIAVRARPSPCAVNTPGTLGGVGATAACPGAHAGLRLRRRQCDLRQCQPMNLISIRRLVRSPELTTTGSGRAPPSKEAEVVRTAAVYRHRKRRRRRARTLERPRVPRQRGPQRGSHHVPAVQPHHQKREPHPLNKFVSQKFQ